LIVAIAGAQVAGCAADGTERSTGRVLDDSVITARVKTALIEVPQVDALDVDVTTYRGVVQLSGFVESREQARRAEQAAQRVEGVRSVKNDLRIAGATR
jgi:osmotically-inducible protein OsmY